MSRPAPSSRGSTTAGEHATTRPVPATRDSVRRSIADQLLGALDELVARHRALALHGETDGEHLELHAELIAAEVAHQLAMTRAALYRHPPLGRAG